VNRREAVAGKWREGALVCIHVAAWEEGIDGSPASALETVAAINNCRRAYISTYDRHGPPSSTPSSAAFRGWPRVVVLKTPFVAHDWPCFLVRRAITAYREKTLAYGSLAR
jgi:hypothetical protein